MSYPVDQERQDNQDEKQQTQLEQDSRMWSEEEQYHHERYDWYKELDDNNQLI